MDKSNFAVHILFIKSEAVSGHGWIRKFFHVLHIAKFFQIAIKMVNI